MLYPLKFKPVYKDYIWGGRNLEKLGKVLPDGIVAESWEISCHPDGVSIVANGDFEGRSLPDLVKELGRELLGSALEQKDIDKFPLLVKFIDANDNLSVQVHPDDNYAFIHENGEYGKNEMWYIISAEPGAKLIYDVVPGTTRENFADAVKSNSIASCLKSIEVFPGDVINIPAGLIHAIGKGIVLAEIQQNSNTTYRVYDYDRVDKKGSKRPLHIEKALDVIDFNATGRKEKFRGLKIQPDSDYIKKVLVVCRYFAVEQYTLNGTLNETADGRKFYLYTFTEGDAELTYGNNILPVRAGESLLIPASLGTYSIQGNAKLLKSYVPDISKDIITPLTESGYTMQQMKENIAGIG